MADAQTQAAAIALLDLCKAKKLMVATAESCTGGLVAGALTDIAGSSAVVDRGFVTYTNEAKQQMLGVPAETLRAHGAVSRANRRGDGEGRAGAFAGRSLGFDHRHRRAGRRNGGEAGRPRAFRVRPRAAAS